MNNAFIKFILTTFNDDELMEIKNSEFKKRTPAWFRQKISKRVVTKFLGKYTVVQYGR